MSQVSVVIAAHNAANTIQRAVDSVLAQPQTAEVIVVDDASTDDTAARARAADDGSRRVKVLSLPVNAGPSAARNHAIGESKAPWIAILDADDYFLPGRLEKLLAFAAGADFIADDPLQEEESAAERRRKSLLNLHPATPPRQIGFSEFVLSNISDPARPRGELGFLKPLMRRDFLEAHGLRYQERLRLGEDYEFYARALAHGARFLLVPPQGYVAVMRPDSLSGRHTEADLRNLRDCDRALEGLAGLTAGDKTALRRHYLSVDCRLQWRLLINAVKERDAGAALGAFARPYPVPFYLLARLVEQLAVRTSRKLKRSA